MKPPNIFEISGCEYTACIGTNGFIDGQTYALGYFRAADVMLQKIFSSEARGSDMDTMVYPILYSIRHGIELSIKYLLTALHAADQSLDLKNIQSHDLSSLWQSLLSNIPFDRRLKEHIETLHSLVDQIDKADASGQEFRYHLDVEGKKTLEEHCTINLISVAEILILIQKEFKKLFWFTDEIIDERSMGAFTTQFNRQELRLLSVALPNYSNWTSSREFTDIKQEWISQYNLSSRDFCRAVNFIKKHPEFAANIGIESELIHLTEDDITSIANAHIHYLKRRPKSASGFTEYTLGESIPNRAKVNFSSIASKLSAEAIGEFKAIASIGRDDGYSENFVSYLNHLTPKDIEVIRIREFDDFFYKLPLLSYLVNGLRKVGCRKISLEVQRIYDEHISCEQSR